MWRLNNKLFNIMGQWRNQKREIKNYLKINENKYAIHQNLWDITEEYGDTKNEVYSTKGLTSRNKKNLQIYNPNLTPKETWKRTWSIEGNNKDQNGNKTDTQRQ